MFLCPSLCPSVCSPFSPCVRGLLLHPLPILFRLYTHNGLSFNVCRSPVASSLTVVHFTPAATSVNHLSICETIQCLSPHIDISQDLVPLFFQRNDSARLRRTPTRLRRTTAGSARLRPTSVRRTPARPTSVRSTPGWLRRTAPGWLRRTAPGWLRRTTPGWLRRTAAGWLRRTTPGWLRRTACRLRGPAAWCVRTSGLWRSSARPCGAAKRLCPNAPTGSPASASRRFPAAAARPPTAVWQRH